MVNTRILEERLGWRSPSEDEGAAPPSRPIAHRPVLQGRVDAGSRGGLRRAGPARLHRRAELEELWEDIPVVLEDLDRLGARGPAPSFARGTVTGALMDQLRGQVLRLIDEKGLRRIGVTSARRGAGRSFVAAGLAASIARLETVRVMLIDADLEDPGLAEILDIDAPGPLEAVLSGQVTPESHLRRVGSELVVALNAAPLPQAVERMMAPEAILALRGLVDTVSPDVVIQDLPPLLNDSVAAALLPQLDAVLLVADGMRNKSPEIVECERLLDGQVPLLGVVLNKSEDRDPRVARRRG